MKQAEGYSRICDGKEWTEAGKVKGGFGKTRGNLVSSLNRTVVN